MDSLGQGLHQSGQRQAVSGTSPDTGQRQHVPPREGVHGLEVGRAPEHDGVSAGTAPHDGSGDPVPTPDPFKLPGESWLLHPPQKRLQGTPGNSKSLWPAAGDTHLTDLSPHRDWSRPPSHQQQQRGPASRQHEEGMWQGSPSVALLQKFCLWLPISLVSPTWPRQGLAPGGLWRLIQGWAGSSASVLFCSPK